MKFKRVRLILLAMVCCLLLIDCAGKRKIQSTPKDPAVLYSKGMTLFNKGKYKEAEEVFTQVKNYFPSDEIYAPKADLRVADSYFLRKEYPEAITRYTEFKKRHPFHPDVPYVEFQIGLCYYRQISPEDRCQKATEKSLSAFQNVVSNYPDTIFAQKAREKIVSCRNTMAAHELYVARFYLRKGKYVGAANRAASVLARYPASGIEDETLYVLSLALHEQEKDPEALAQLTRLVQEYPQSPFAKKGKRLVASLKAEGVVAASTVHDEGARMTKPPGEIGREAIPFRIRASNRTRVPEKNAIMYTGDVAAFGSDVTIRAESLLLTMEESGAPREMVATGEVKVVGGGEEIFCNKAVWSPTRQVLVMTGGARIRGAAEWIRGDEITLHLDTGRIAIKGREVQKMDEGTGP